MCVRTYAIFAGKHPYVAFNNDFREIGEKFKMYDGVNVVIASVTVAQGPVSTMRSLHVTPVFALLQAV